MINVIKEDSGNRSILVEITNLTQEQLAEVTKELYKNGGSTCSCGQYIMVCFGKSRTNYEKMVELVEDIKRRLGIMVDNDKKAMSIQSVVNN